MITGLTRGTTRAHLARATLEGVAFSVADLGRAMEADMGARIARLRVDGGASENGLLMQFQSDVLDVTIDRPANVETTALGAAYLAGLAVGAFDGLDAVRKAHRVAKDVLSCDERERSCYAPRSMGRRRVSDAILTLKPC